LVVNIPEIQRNLVTRTRILHHFCQWC